MTAGSRRFGSAQAGATANHTALLGTYAEMQEKAATVLGEATTVFSGLSLALDQVADAYQAGDEDAATRLKGVWDVHE